MVFFSAIATNTTKGDFFMKLSVKFKESAKELKNIHSLAVMAMLVALCVVFEKFLAIPLVGNLKQIKFTIIPAAISGMLYGPVAGTIVVAAGDTLANLEMFSPLYFLSALVTGLICGLFFYKQGKLRLKRVIVALTVVTVLVYMIMNTCWAAVYGGLKKEWALWFRMLTILIQYPVDIACTFVVLNRLCAIPSLNEHIYKKEIQKRHNVQTKGKEIL